MKADASFCCVVAVSENEKVASETAEQVTK